MRKKIALALSALMMVSMAACSVQTGTEGSSSEGGSEAKSTSGSSASGSGEFSGVTIEIADNYTGSKSTAFAELVDAFEAETGCTVNVSEYGTDYENTMKTRMASNELPDIFQTHGWSILRYKEYLLDVSDQPWVSDYDESALGVIQDDDGAIYVLMTSELVNGTLVNLDVCEAAGVDPYSIHTYEDLTAAAQKIKDAGYTPFGVITNPGLLANFAGTWVSYEGELAEDSDAMLDGTWDWESYRAFLEQHAEWIEAGYFYDDIMTMNDTDLTQRWAQDKAAFNLGNDPSLLNAALELNPDGNYAFLPSFASKEGGKEFVGIGEGDTFGIWKDSKNIDACKAFLEFMARPENTVALSNATGNITCLKSAMEQDQSYGLQVFTTMQEKCADCNILYENLWDRKYMPSGMWSIFGNAMNMLLDDHSDGGIDATLEYLIENYQDLYENAQSE